MRVFVATSLASVALIVAASAFGSVRVAHACSAGPDFNPAAGAELVVAGYITDLEILGRTGTMTYLDLAMTFEVDRYLFGDGPSTLRVHDNRSGVPPRHLIPNSKAFAELDLESLNVDELGYDGSGGACGALNADPRGRYWVIGLSRNPEDERLWMGGPTTFAVGFGASDPVVIEGVVRARAALTEAGLTPSPAATGSGPMAQTDGDAVSIWKRSAWLLSVPIALGAGRLFVSRARSNRR